MKFVRLYVRVSRTLARYIFDITTKVCNLRMYIFGLLACMWRYPRTLARYTFDIAAKVVCPPVCGGNPRALS